MILTDVRVEDRAKRFMRIPPTFLWPAALVMMVAASAVQAAPIHTAAELAKIQTAADERTKALLEPRTKLDEQFKAALKKFGEKARATGDVAGELDALRALNDLEAGTLVPGQIEHPGVAGLAKIHAEESRKLVAVAMPGLQQIRVEKLAALRKLARRLEDAGMFEDAKALAPTIAGVEEEVKSPPEVGVFMTLPRSMRFRTEEKRRQMISLEGGTMESEEAVLKGLRWLKATQNADGSWTGGNQCAMTGLALLAYLGHSETPLSEEFGDSCLRAITFLIDRGMSKDGVMASSGEKNHLPYEHAIATYALAEAVAFCEQVNISIPNLPEVTLKAGQFIINNQHESGGWDYGYDEASGRGGDLSISSWQIMALAACREAGLPLKNLEPCIKRALDYVENRQDSSGGFGYAGKGDSHAPNGYHTLTGAGMLCLQMWNKVSAGSVRSGAKYLEKKSRFDFSGEDCDLYGHYFEALAMRLRGGDAWKLHQARVMPQLIENQNPDGSWKMPGGGKKPNAVAAAFTSNVHYRNCLCILILESYYRVVLE